jgi:hypothetical protein
MWTRAASRCGWEALTTHSGVKGGLRVAEQRHHKVVDGLIGEGCGEGSPQRGVLVLVAEMSVLVTGRGGA